MKKIDILKKLLPDSLIDYLSAKIVMYGHKKDPIHDLEIVVLKKILKKEDKVIDCGANIGKYSLFFAKTVGKKGHVYAFEPFLPTFKKLAFLKKVAMLDNLSCFNVALSDRNGIARMDMEKEPDGSLNYFSAYIIPEERVTKINCPRCIVTTIDSLFLGKKINFIKCDTEGSDLQVMKGGINLIKECNPNMMVEVDEKSYNRNNSSVKELFELLTGLGLVPFSLNRFRKLERVSAESIFKIENPNVLWKRNRKNLMIQYSKNIWNVFFLNKKGLKELNIER